MKTDRAIILIDGSNFYFKLKDLGLHTLSFNYSAFVKKLAGTHQIIKSTYFVGEVRTDGSAHTQKLYDNQQRLLAQLKKHTIRYQFGYLLKSGGVFHEKGVDVHLAVQLLVAAYEAIADRLILVSSDTDLIPAIQKAQEKGKIVEYVGFSHKISLALARSCKETKTLTREDLQTFVEPTSLKKALLNSSVLGGVKAKGLELSELDNLLEEIIQAQKNTVQKEAFTRLCQNVPHHPTYTYEY